MAQLTGSLGKITFSADIGMGTTAGACQLLANHWEATLYKLGVADITAFSPSSNTRAGLATICDRATGRVSGFHDSAAGFSLTNVQLGTPVAAVINLYLDANSYYYFTGALSGWQVSTDVGQPITWSADFEATGAVSASMA